MCIIEKFDKVPLIWIELIVILISGTSHIILAFTRNMPEFNAYELFNSSPIFDLSLFDFCVGLQTNIFHTWGGWKRYESSSKDSGWKFYDETNITKINGYCFSYKYKSYISLLNNGQIIKNGTECPKEYNKNCGRIDTLNQELCIEENEKCPLYDIGIGLPPDPVNYIYHNNSNVYYNNENYNDTNKTIIGRLILNEGQPCYQLTEKLWRKFSPMEVMETHLNCTNITIFGKKIDDRFIQRGSITYRRLYKDNLDLISERIVFNSSIGYETVNLYKREFLGIDKKCDEKFNLINDFNELRNSQKIDKVVQIFEGIPIASISLVFLIIEIISACVKERIISPKIYFGFFLFYICAVGGFSVSHILSYMRKIKLDYSIYNCSDIITNEIIKKGNEDNKKTMIPSVISFFIDAVMLASNFLGFIIGIILIIIDKCENKYKSLNNNSEVDETPYYANYPSCN